MSFWVNDNLLRFYLFKENTRELLPKTNRLGNQNVIHNRCYNPTDTLFNLDHVASIENYTQPQYVPLYQLYNASIFLYACIFRAKVTQPSASSEFHNSFKLLQGEQVLNQWTSEECCNARCGNINHTILTDRRVLLRVNKCSIFSCLCEQCCKRSTIDRALYLDHIAEVNTKSMSFFGKLFSWVRCGCPQDGLDFRGSFTNIQSRTAFLTEADKPDAQLAMCDAIAKASKRH